MSSDFVKKQRKAIIIVYFQLKSNCPKIHTHMHCATRQKLHDLPMVYGIPYSIKRGKIYYPEKWHDKTTGMSFDIRTMAQELCAKCKYGQDQKTR